MNRFFICLACSIFVSFFATSSYASLGFLKFFIPTKYANCGQALPTNHPSFCESFRTVAECHCTSSGLPSKMCKDMDYLYKQMLNVFGSQEKACRHQQDAPFQTCMDDWNCYRSGGRDSLGRLCSSTGKKC